MKSIYGISVLALVMMVNTACNQKAKTTKKELQIKKEVTAQDILGNTAYLAISYGGYRATTRNVQPTIEELKEDMRILSAMNIKLLRTYNVQLQHASNVLKAIRQLKEENPKFEMYVMLGAWIDCKNAWTGLPLDHDKESEHNEAEIERAVALTRQYADIVKIIAVGNEAMVKWAESYYVQPGVILKWVKHLQALKKEGTLSKDLWITSSDNFASWGGGSTAYHVTDLEKLWKAVDFVSMHTYPMHDTHYNPIFWGLMKEEQNSTKPDRIEKAMLRAKAYAMAQYDSVVGYMNSIGVEKPIHIGETGWASVSNGHYGPEGSKATDEYKEALYYQHMREWTEQQKMSCFYFEAFDEQWKDAQNPEGSENHFGLFTLKGAAKYALWDKVDQGAFNGLTRNGNPISKTYNGNAAALLEEVLVPPMK